MPAQLRADVVRSLAAACDRVKADGIEAPYLVDDVMQLVDVAFRFLEQDHDIWEARRTVLERLECTMQMIDRLMDQQGPAPAEGHSGQAVATARAHAVEAINRPQAKVLEQGRANAAGDRVGLGKTGALIR